MTALTREAEPPPVRPKGQLLFTTTEAGRLLHLSRSTVYSLINDGALRPVHVGRSCRITLSELERYVSRLDSAIAADQRDLALANVHARESDAVA